MRFRLVLCGIPIALLLAAAEPTMAAGADSRIRALAAAAGQREPLMRIGLEAEHRISVSSRTPFEIVEPSSGEAVWKPRFSGEIQIVAHGGPKDGVPAIYRVQVGAFSDPQAAEAELDRLSRVVGTSGVVHHDPDRGNWRVRLGRADDRLSLNPLMEKLRRAGVQGLWIAEEPARPVSDVRLRLVDDAYDSFSTAHDRLVVVPTDGDLVTVGETAYRGVVELRLSPFGTVRPINWIGLESYLRGVVPAELGPEVWPQIAALEAQAVAARTYAWRNREQFAEEGFDLCATPRCQVYAGATAEHPLSDRAVAATRGEILVWNGTPITALYTATCGGHTEDGREIFPEHDQPYLRGVPCRAEGEALATLRSTVEGHRLQPVFDETGADVTRDWALLVAAGVLDAGNPDQEVGGRILTAGQLREWTRALARLAGRPEPAGAALPAANLAQAVTALLADLGWSERAEVLLSPEDLPALLRDPEAATLAGAQQRALAYLAWVEGIQPFADGRFHPQRPVSWARMVPGLVRIAERYEAFGLRDAVVAGAGQKSLRLIQGKGSIRLPLGAGPRLFGRAGGRPVAAERLEIWPGDRVRFRTDPDGSIDFLELLAPIKGASDDRTSRVYSWEVRKTRRQLEEAINRRVSIGRLKDLRVVRRGVSGRVVELEVVGRKASTVVRGFDVRRLLNLRESLLVIEPQRDARGVIEAVVFAGKGWGHGVGLCQVGAYGMALRGASYREILAHYYAGSALFRGASPGS